MAATQMVTDSMRAQAQVLLARAGSWPREWRKLDGMLWYRFASSRTDREGNPIYWRTRADAQGCTCKSWLFRGNCSHAVAVRLAAERDQERQERAATTWTYCSGGCGELLSPQAGTTCGHCASKPRFSRDYAALYGPDDD